MAAAEFELLDELEEELEEEALEIEPFFAPPRRLGSKATKKPPPPRARNGSREHKRLLLAVSVLPDTLLDELQWIPGFSGAKWERLDGLRRQARQLWSGDKNFKQQVETERQLDNDMFHAAWALAKAEWARSSKVPQKFKYHLRAALVEDYVSPFKGKWGFNFAQALFPPELRERIIRSEISEVHFDSLGRYVRVIAEEYLRMDPEFKQLVEQERKKQRTP